MSTTNIGQFLYSVRIRRGYNSISEYLRDYTDMPISESYYRDLETGRKIIRLDTAEMLYRALKLEKKEFYYHLLRDMLPADVADELLKPIPSDTFKSPSEQFTKDEKEISVLRKAYEKRLVEEPYIVDIGIVKYLDDNFEVLPLIHFIYLRDKCSFEELEKIMKKNNISRPLNQVIEEFKRYTIASINWDEKTVTRYSRIFRIPKIAYGIQFKDKFLKSEIEQTLQLSNREQKIGPNSNFVFSVISSLKGEDGLAKISNLISGLIAQIEVEESQEKGALPYFVTVIFSSRENYALMNDD